MKKKKLLIILVAAMVWIGLSVHSAVRIKDFYKPCETTAKIWVPGEYSIVNQIGGHYTPISDVHLSGTAVYVPFPNFKENLAGRSTDVIIQTNGLVYYIVEQAGVKFFTKLDYAPYGGDRLHRFEVIISDLTAKNFYGRGWNDIAFESLIMLIVWGIVIAVLYLLLKLCLPVGKWMKSMRIEPA